MRFLTHMLKYSLFLLCSNCALYSDRVLDLRCIKLLLCFYYQAANELACAKIRMSTNTCSPRIECSVWFLLTSTNLTYNLILLICFKKQKNQELD